MQEAALLHGKVIPKSGSGTLSRAAPAFSGGMYIERKQMAFDLSHAAARALRRAVRSS